MRIISGKFKGKKLFQPIDKATRPLKDIVKESIFNLLIHSNIVNFNLDKSIILDTFSGTGSFGLECLSRNAAHVTFIENHGFAIKILKKNISLLKNVNNFNIIEKNIFKLDPYRDIKKHFDIIFFDPPFKENKIENLFKFINSNKILNKNGVVILHRDKKNIFKIPKDFNLIDERIYGISKISLFRLF